MVISSKLLSVALIPLLPPKYLLYLFTLGMYYMPQVKRIKPNIHRPAHARKNHSDHSAAPHTKPQYEYTYTLLAKI